MSKFLHPAYNWGVISGEMPFTNRYAEKNVTLETQYVKSNLHPDLHTAFYLNDGTWLRTLDGFSGQWMGGTNVLGGNSFSQPLPEKLHLTYFSLFENQFYQLDAQLPTAEIEKIMKSKHLGMYQHSDYGMTQHYEDIAIDIAPQGYVLISVVTDRLNRKVVASFQAKKIQADYTEDIVVVPTDNLDWYKAQNILEGHRKDFAEKVQKYAKPYYEAVTTGKNLPSSDWVKSMQTKYPWKLEVSDAEGQWLGEYSASFANTEKYDILRDQVEQEKYQLKPIPTKIKTWVVDNETKKRYYMEIDLFPKPRWSAESYDPYYKDPNLEYFAKRFQHFFPNRSLATNNQPAKPEEFATLKIKLNDEGGIDVALQKGNEILPIDGAYLYYLSEVDPKKGGYEPYDGNAGHFITTPKIKDLSDPALVDMDE